VDRKTGKTSLRLDAANEPIKLPESQFGTSHR
jgi:hypothetical protein